MNFFAILQSEILKTKRSLVKRIAIASPLCLALLAVIQGGYYSLNLFNWFYVIFLPATLALITATSVNIDGGKNGLRPIRVLPISQNKIFLAKLLTIFMYGLCSCLLISISVLVVPTVLSMLDISQTKTIDPLNVLYAAFVMFITTMWQIPLSFIIANYCGLIITVITNLFISFLGVSLALKPYWFLCPWSWVNRSMVIAIKVLPNGLPVEKSTAVKGFDLILALILSIIFTIILNLIASSLFAKTEAR